MTDKPEERIINLIQRCLALSESSNEHEAAAAMRKVQELLEKHNLDMRTVQEMPAEDAIQMADIPIPIGTDNWRRDLLTYVAQANFCEAIITGHQVHLLGRSVNASATFLTGIWIINQLDIMADVKTAAYSGVLGKRKFRNSFLHGAVARINERLIEGRQ